MKLIHVTSVLLLPQTAVLALAPLSTSKAAHATKAPDGISALSRRQAVSAATSSLAVLLPVLLQSSSPAHAAAAAGPTPAELDRIKSGYEQINYLLDHFDEETTVCNPECKRNADAIRKALGLRSTTDTLFQIEKVFDKVKNMDLDPDKLDDFFQG